MSRRIELSAAAERQLDECLNYASGTWDADTAQDYVAALLRTLTLLAAMPRVGRRIGEYRRFRYERHIVYYRASKTHLFVLRIVPERRAPAGHL